MPIATREEECKFGSRDPSVWPSGRHGSGWLVLEDYGSHGKLQHLQRMLVNCGAHPTAEAMDSVASSGQYQDMLWLHKSRSEGCTTEAMDAAATNGHLDVVKFLHANRSEGCTTAAMDSAVTIKARGGSPMAACKPLRRVLDCSDVPRNDNRKERCTPAAMINAASTGCLDVVKYLHTEVGQAATDAAITAAAENYHLLVVEYLHEIRCNDCKEGPGNSRRERCAYCSWRGYGQAR